MIFPSVRRHAPLFVMAAAYALFVFPFAYFRHDDWLILGNGAALPDNWAMLWNPTLLFPDGEHIWFFRPFFKLATYLFYSAFGFHYWMWLCGTLAITLAALCLGADTIGRLTGKRERALWFLTLFAAAVPLHFGSLAWIGEGLMNCPLALGLVLSTWLVCRGLLEARRDLLALAVPVFTLTLGFKESAVFHVAFLFALLLTDEKLRQIPLRSRALVFAPYAAISAVYLVVRLLYLPLNREYLPDLTLHALGKPALLIAAMLLVPAALAARTHSLRGLGKKWLFVPFLVVTVLPYLGHPFFSPGWLFYPGFFLLFILSLGETGLGGEPRRIALTGLAVLAVSLGPVLYELNRMGWWHWNQGQREMRDSVAALEPASLSTLEVYSCQNDRYPLASFERVVAYDASLWFMWRLHHKTDLPVVVGWCSTLKRGLASKDERAAILLWEFPKLTWVKRPAEPGKF